MKKTKKTVYNIFQISLLVTVIAAAIVVTFLHEYELKESESLSSLAGVHSGIIKERNASLEDILLKLENRTITIDEYISKRNEIKLSSNKKIKAYKSKKKEIKQNDKVLGYTSKKNFLLSIGTRIFSFVISLLLLALVVKNVKNKLKKRFYLIVSFALVTTAGYWLIWSALEHAFDPVRGYDWNRNYYDIALYVLPSLIFISSYYIFKYQTDYVNTLMLNIKDLLGFILKNTKADKRAEMLDVVKNIKHER